MPKNTGIGGNKRKKGKKLQNEERELQFKSEMQEYGQVIKLYGDSRLEIQCTDMVKRIGHIRGKMRKKVWIASGDVVLVALREYENDKCDVILKYTEDEVRKLKKCGEIPDSIKLPESVDANKEGEGDYGDVVFGGDDDDKSGDEGNNFSNKKKNTKEMPPSDDSDDDDDKPNVDDI
jgi:translation initiation factor 1A